MKKTVYVLLAMVLGILLSFLLHLPFVLNFFLTPSDSCVTHSDDLLSILCVFPTWALWTTVVLGSIGGYFLGKTWWRIIYVEKRWFHPMKKRRKRK